MITADLLFITRASEKRRMPKALKLAAAALLAVIFFFAGYGIMAWIQ